jgi:ferredoxin
VRVIVDRDLCDNHGLCAITAPDVFELDDEGKLVHREEVDESLRSAVEEAADGCPLQAISIAD